MQANFHTIHTLNRNSFIWANYFQHNKKIQETIESTVGKAEEQYLLLSEKSAELTGKFHSQNKELATKAGCKLRELNVKAGDALAELIAKVEKEPTAEEKVIEAVDKSADATKSVVEKTAGKVKKVAKKVEKVTKEATA